MAQINGATGSNVAEVDANGTIHTGLFDVNGNPIVRTKGGAYTSTDHFMPIAGLNDGVYRPVRLDRMGGQAIAKYTPMIEYMLYTAALMPQWLAPATTMTVTHSVTSGTLLNAASGVALNTHAALVSMQAVPKTQRSPLFFRTRARLVKGGTNGAADIGMTTTQAPAQAELPNGFIFRYLADGSLRPLIVFNGTVVATGTDFASSIDSTRYYTWDIMVDDNSVNFVVQDATSGAIVTDQILAIGADAGRIGSLPYFFAFARSYVGAVANAGLATQVYVGDATAGLLDMDAEKPWSHVMAALGKGGIVNPAVALAQLANYANSAAPVSATLSNTAAGYTTLGGQFQFAAPAGAETDFALFAFTVPTGVKLAVTGISIDTMNTGAAVATTETWMQWFAGPDAAAVTLATNSFRTTLGNQVFPIGAAIGAQAQRIDAIFDTPLVTNSGRIFHLGLKIPRGTATASQIIRGIARVNGYFE
jgi:hypothetical protein